MALSVSSENGSGIVTIQASGSAPATEYEGFFAAFEKAVKQRSRVGLLLRFQDFAGWDMDALSRNVPLDIGCLLRIKRLAVIGERKWEEWIKTYCGPFMGAAVRCFQPGQEDDARKWLAETVA